METESVEQEARVSESIDKIMTDYIPGNVEALAGDEGLDRLVVIGEVVTKIAH